MSVGRWTLERATAIRLAAFAALAALAGAQWVRLVEAPPVGRAAVAVGIACVGATALVAIATARPSRAVAWPLAALALLAAAVAGVVAIGIPLRLLDPGDWGELADRIGRGFSGLAGDVPYPYARDNAWSRVVLLAGLPLALALAAALAFWPARRGERLRRTAPLVVLAAAFGIGAIVVPPDQPLLWGVALLAATVVWRWAPTLTRRDALAAVGVVAAAGAAAIPVAGWLDSAEPRVDFRDWELGRGKAATFDWNHSYGPLDWPRDGTALAAMESDRPQYWRAAVLDEFDGVAWQRPEQSFGERLELPTAAEGGAADGSLSRDRRRWIEEIGVTIGPMETEFVLSAGAIVSVEGLENALSLPNGTTVTGADPLEEGDDYRVLSYAPDPSAAQLRRAPDEYASALARYTQLTIPARAPGAEPQFVQPSSETNVQVPLRGAPPAPGDRAAGRAIASSPYADTYDLARRLTRGEPTSYDAARSIEAHFQSGFTYTEEPGEHRLPLAGFLFDDRTGYCQQFSGAMALMLRMSGIPSRVVSGFSPGSPDPDEDDRYLISDLDAHSWVEAYFTGIGWVTFDPTPSAAPATGRREASGLASLGAVSEGDNPGNLRRKGFTPPEGGTADPTAPAVAGGGFPVWTIPAGVGIIGLAALAFAAAITAVRRHRYGRLSPAARAAAHLNELPVALARLGWPLSRAETLLALETRLRRYRKDAAARYIHKLRTTRFSPAPDGAATLADRRALRNSLAGADGLASRIRGLLALPPGGPSGSRHAL